MDIKLDLRREVNSNKKKRKSIGLSLAVVTFYSFTKMLLEQNMAKGFPKLDVCGAYMVIF